MYVRFLLPTVKRIFQLKKVDFLKKEYLYEILPRLAQCWPIVNK